MGTESEIGLTASNLYSLEEVRSTYDKKTVSTINDQ